jgi:hypothetical protein
MKYPLTLRVFTIIVLLFNGFFPVSHLFAQSSEVIHNSTATDSPEKSRSEPSVIFRIENTLTPPSEFFEYLDMNFSAPVSIEQVSPGEFHIFNLVPFRSYFFEFKGSGPMLLGVTTADISKIQRYILGMSDLDPDRIIAADVTCDGRVSAADLVDIRRVILGKSPAFSCNKSWKFIPATAEFLFTGTTIDLGTIKAIKIGHVN